MPVTVINNGNNTVKIAQDFIDSSGGTITIIGDGSHVVIGAGSNSYERMTLTCGPGSTVHIGHGVRLASVQFHVCSKAELRIGDHSSFVNEGQIFIHEPKPVVLGKGCLISENVSIRASDAHSIIDLETGARINHARPIHIGNRVWLGRNVSVLKGAVIGDESVIGAESIVTGEIPPNAIALGTPARVHRLGVTWDINVIPEDPAVLMPEGAAADAAPRVSATEEARRAQVALDEANHRITAMQTVLEAVLASQRWPGLNRQRFKMRIVEAGRALPKDGPATAQHAVLLAGARKVLGLEDPTK